MHIGEMEIRIDPPQKGNPAQSMLDAVEAVYASDETKRRFEILARQVFIRFKALLTRCSGK